MKNKKNLFNYFFPLTGVLIFLYVFSLLFLPIFTLGEEGEIYKVDVNEAKFINEHGECRMVVNNGSIPIMVPTGRENEWANFRVNRPGIIDVEDCPPVIILNERTSQNCNTLCNELEEEVSCQDIGTNDDEADNGKFWATTAPSVCDHVDRTCSTNANPPGEGIWDASACGGRLPEWTYCRCEY